jgi:O-antigen/teichoic acid export membrane protein
VAVRWSTGTALALGLLAAALVAGVAAALAGPARSALLALAIVLPALLLQDAWRYAFLATGDPVRAVVNDGFWAGMQLLLVGGLIATGRQSVGTLVLAWGAAGACSAVLGVFQAGVVPQPVAARRWLRRHADLVPRFLGEFLVSTGVSQLSLWLVGVVSGLSTLGALRGAMVLIGPLRIFVTAAPAAAIPELVRRHRGDPLALRRAALLIGTALATAVAAWGVVASVAPDSVGEAILGDIWGPAQRLVPYVAVAWAAYGFSAGAFIGLRVQEDARRSLRAQTFVAPFVLVLPVLGAAGWDLVGAGVGYALATSVSAPVWWRAFLTSGRDVSRARTLRARAVPGDGGPAPVPDRGPG